MTSAGFEATSEQPHEQPNYVPCAARDLPVFKPYLVQLSALISEAKKAPTASEHASSGLVDELMKLSALHDAGALTDEEYTAAKAKLLG